VLLFERFVKLFQLLDLPSRSRVVCHTHPVSERKYSTFLK
jgi:hypothetical protein